VIRNSLEIGGPRVEVPPWNRLFGGIHEQQYRVDVIKVRVKKSVDF
jgi:hypothetical protein